MYHFYVLTEQIFRVPYEERRYKTSDPAFGGENQQAAVVRDIMVNTGCKIEMSQSKDLSLTIMVTGRPTAVKEAQKMIMTELHTKVRWTVHWILFEM